MFFVDKFLDFKLVTINNKINKFENAYKLNPLVLLSICLPMCIVYLSTG